MAEIINDSEKVERVRKAVLKLGSNVTVGDVMSVTGLGADEAKAGLDSLIQTHEGTMRVSEKGELQYSFAGGCILRDQRSWWQRNKKAVMKVVKGLFKVIIMLVLVVYFVIFVLLLLALLCSNRGGSRSNINLGWMWYFFWGTSSSTSSNQYRKDPLYTRVYNFVFGPEEVEVDPLEARTKCAQLIRAKNGVITVEDWMMISGQSREKCESDLARFTAEFDGAAEITDNGTLVYVFESMMMSTKSKKREEMPEASWMVLEKPRPLSGNTPENGGNGAVIGLNTFNLIMSFVIMFSLRSVIGASVDTTGMTAEQAMIAQTQMEQLQQYSFWLGIFPFIFSSLIFLGPLVRLPGNRRENRERRARSVRKAVLCSVFDNQNSAQTTVSFDVVSKKANACLLHNQLVDASADEINTALNTIVCELGGERDFDKNVYTFENMDTRLKDAKSERNSRDLAGKAMGRVVYSTDNREQERIDDENEKADMDDFDRLLTGSDHSSQHYGEYDQHYSGKSSANAHNRSYY